MIRTGLVLVAVLIALTGPAFADVVLVADPEPTEGVNRDRLWNPFIGTRPWIEPIGYHIPARTVTVRTDVAPSTTVSAVGEEGWYSCANHEHGSDVRVIREHHHHDVVRQ